MSMAGCARHLRTGLVAALAVGAWAIGRGSVVYFREGREAPFVIDKDPLVAPWLDTLWFVALRTHVLAAAFALLAVVVLLSRTLRAVAPRGHRLLGRVVAVVVVFAVAPSACVLAFAAKGGLPSTAGFLLSTGLTTWAMVRAVGAAREGREDEHRRFALHVTAQLSVAVTSRAILRLTFDTSMDPTVAYWLSLWAPMLVGVVVVETLTRQGTSSVVPSR